MVYCYAQIPSASPFLVSHLENVGISPPKCEMQISAKYVQQFWRRCIPSRQTNKQTNSKLNISPLPRGDSNTNPAVRLLLVKFIKHNQKLLPKTLRFDLYQRPSSEEAGTQFFRFLTRQEDGVSRKRSYAWLSW